MATRKELEARLLEGDLALERMLQENSSDPVEEEAEEDDDDEKMSCVLPLLCDTWEEACAEAAASSAEEAEWRRREADEKARQAEEEKRQAEEKKRRKDEAVWRRKKHEEVYNSIRQYNPKTKCVEYTRFPFADLSTFNLDEPCMFNSAICIPLFQF
jgi:hypothetical protein